MTPALFSVMAIAFLFAIGILISAHEFGHFWVARRLGFKVLRFSIGFGKPLLLRRGRDGVEYVLGAIPLGGYVRLADEREAPVAEADLARAFNRRPIWQRILVLVAGAAANFLFAILAYWVLFMNGIPGTRPVLGPVRADSLAAHADLKAGDVIESIGGHAVATRESFVLELISDITDDGRIALGIRRGGGVQAATILVPPEQRRAMTEPGGWQSGLGFEFTAPHVGTVLGKVLPDGAAAAAGLQSGDQVLAADGHPVSEFTDLQAVIRAHAGTPVALEVLRGASHRTVTVVPRATPDPKNPNAPPAGLMGVTPGGGAEFPPEMRTVERYGPIAAFGAAIEATASKSALTLKLLWRMLTGRVSIKNVSGPIGIATYAGISALEGPATYLEFLALISISLGVLNLLPVPILDGGQVVYQLAEAIAGRPLPERVQILGQQLGIVLLVLLMSLAFYNDITARFG